MRRLFLTLMLATACGPVDLTIVNVPDGGNFVPPTGPSCADSNQCDAGQYCEKSGCGVALGHCVQRPAVCTSDGPPQCGCDGVTYWNECLRKRAGVESARENGPCTAPRACDTTTPCPTGGYCARLVRPQECGRVVAGACWDLPDGTCTGPGPRYIQCGAAPPCVDACTAIRSEQPMAEMRGPGSCP
jgi:hypothetical protein